MYIERHTYRYIHIERAARIRQGMFLEWNCTKLAIATIPKCYLNRISVYKIIIIKCFSLNFQLTFCRYLLY